MCMPSCGCDPCKAKALANKMPKTQVNVSVLTSGPMPGIPTKPRKSVEDKVRDMIELVESGHDSVVEWGVLTKLYKELCRDKSNPRVVNLIKMISPVLRKHGYYGTIEE